MPLRGGVEIAHACNFLYPYRRMEILGLAARSRPGGLCLCIFLTVLAVLLLAGGQARAADYYVSTSGNDSNNGTSEATAFRTIQKGADVAKTGDTVIVLPGTYNGSLTQTKDGTA